MTDAPLDRSAEDLGNIVNLGHVNYRIPDQQMATEFYVSGLGLTRDPAMMTATNNMWVNVGDSQFHLPTGEPVIAPGIVTGLVMPDLAALRERLDRVRKNLKGTKFSFSETNDYVEATCVEVTCPWGNRVRCHAPDEARFGPVIQSMAYVEFEVPRGAVSKIERFYREIFGALTTLEDGGEGKMLRVSAGERQFLIFREHENPAPACEDHHVQIYVADFSGPYRKLLKASAKIEESSRHQYRFYKIVDVDNGADVFTLDHEIRSLTHPMHGRPLVNRNAMQNARDYRAGQDFLVWRMA